MKINFFGCLLAASTAALSLSEAEFDTEISQLSEVDLDDITKTKGLTDT